MTVEPAKHVVLLSPFFYPEPISTGKYNTNLAEGLRDAGLSILVVASHPLYPDWRPRSAIQKLSGIEILRGGEWIRYPRSTILRRLILELWYLYFLAVELPRRRTTISAAIAVIPPVLFVPLVRRILAGSTPIVGVVHDLQSVFAGKTGSAFRKLLQCAVQRWEGQALRSCDRVIFLSNAMARRAIDVHKLRPERCKVFHPFMSIRKSEQGSGISLSPLFPPDYRHVVYSGALGEKQNPEQLVECFLHLSDCRSDVMCHIFSRGPKWSELRLKYCNQRNLKFHDLVDEADLSELLDRSDVQVLPQAFGTSDAALPSKLPNLIAAGVPILAICEEESEAGALIRESGSGEVVNSWSPAEVSRSLSTLLDSTDGKSRDHRKITASAYVTQHFSLERLVAEIVNFVEESSPSHQ